MAFLSANVVALYLCASGASAETPCVLAPTGKMLCCPPDDAECLARIQGATQSEPDAPVPMLVEPSEPQMLGAMYTFAKSSFWDGKSAFDVALIGVPFGVEGGYEAPGLQAVRRESGKIAPYSRVYGRSITDLNLVDGQDLTVSGTERAKALKKLALRFFKAGKPVVALGGDASISVPLLSAAKQVLGQFAIVHIDKDISIGNGSREQGLTADTAMFWAAANNLVDTRHSLHVGTSGHQLSKKVQLMDEELGFVTLGLEEFALGGVRGVLEQIKRRLQRRDGTYLPAYISVDLDVLEPSYFSGEASAGGLRVHELRALLAGLKEFCYVVGADVRNVAGLTDPSQVKIAASVAHDLVLLAGGRSMSHDIVPPNLQKGEL